MAGLGVRPRVTASVEITDPASRDNNFDGRNCDLANRSMSVADGMLAARWKSLRSRDVRHRGQRNGGCRGLRGRTLLRNLFSRDL